MSTNTIATEAPKRDIPSKFRAYHQTLQRDFLNYLRGFALLAAEPLVLVPILLQSLPAAEISHLGIIEGALVVVGGISQLGLKFAYLQETADRPDAERFAAFWTATTLVVAAGLGLGSVAAAGLAIAGDLFGQQVRIDAWTLAFLCGAENLRMMVLTDLRAMQKSDLFIFISVCQLVLLFLAVKVFLSIWDGSATAILRGQAVASTGTAVIFLFLLPGLRLARPTRRLIQRMLAYGVPIAGGLIFQYIVPMITPWLLLVLFSEQANAAWTLARRFGMIFDVFFGLPFLMAWGGLVYRILAEPNRLVVLNRLWRLATQVGCSVAAGAVVVSWAFLSVLPVDPDLLFLVVTFIPLVIVWRLAFAFRLPFAAGLLSTRRTHWYVWYGLLGSALFAGFVPLLTPSLGPAGIIIAGGLAEAICAVGGLVQGRRTLRRTSTPRQKC